MSGDRRPGTLVVCAVGAGALVLGAAVVMRPTAIAAAVGVAVVGLLLARPAGRLVGFLGGAMLVLGGSSGVGLPKLVYLGYVAVAALIAARRAPRLADTSWGRPMRPLLRASLAYSALLGLTVTVAVAHGSALSDWLRDASGYLLLGVGPVIALDAAATLSARAAARLTGLVGIVAAIGFAAAWLARRGLGSLPLDRIVLPSLPLSAICFAVALVAAFAGRRRAAWATLAVGIPALLLVTGTRSAVVLGVGLLAVVGSARKARVGPGKAMVGACALLAAMAVVLPRLGAGLALRSDFLSSRLEQGTSFLTGGGDASAALRARAYRVVVDAFLQHPVIGWGPGHRFPSLDPTLPPVLTLDTPLLALAKFGVLGSALFIGFLLGFVVAFHRSRKLCGWSNAGTAGRASLFIVIALLPLGAVYEDKGFALGLTLLLLLLLTTDRERAPR